MFFGFGSFSGSAPTADIFAYATSTGNILYASADGLMRYDTLPREDVLGRQDKPVSLTRALAIRQQGDTIWVGKGVHTAAYWTLGSVPDTTFIVEDATLNGRFFSAVTSGIDYGRFVGLGKAFLSGNILINGTSYLSGIYGMTMGSLCNRCLYTERTNFVWAIPMQLFGTYKTCAFTSTAPTFVKLYGITDNGFTLDDCKVSCNDFSASGGGLVLPTSAAVCKFLNTSIACQNFVRVQGNAEIILRNSFVKASGAVWFLAHQTGALRLHALYSAYANVSAILF
jgi:hypothetical protein